jgi:hypothetical protein
MAGLFGLFGGRTKYVDEKDTVESSPEKKDAFFLEPDAAKSLGNTEFMRKPVTIKRSFPKTVNGGGGEFVQQVSSMEKVRLQENGRPATPVKPVTEAETTAPVDTERRRQDSNLDMFRQMAKDLKK